MEKFQMTFSLIVIYISISYISTNVHSISFSDLRIPISAGNAGALSFMNMRNHSQKRKNSNDIQYTKRSRHFITNHNQINANMKEADVSLAVAKPKSVKPKLHSILKRQMAISPINTDTDTRVKKRVRFAMLENDKDSVKEEESHERTTKDSSDVSNEANNANDKLKKNTGDLTGSENDKNEIEEQRMLQKKSKKNEIQTAANLVKVDSDYIKLNNSMKDKNKIMRESPIGEKESEQTNLVKSTKKNDSSREKTHEFKRMHSIVRGKNDESSSKKIRILSEGESNLSEECSSAAAELSYKGLISNKLPNCQDVLEHLGINRALYYYYSKLIKLAAHVSFDPVFITNLLILMTAVLDQLSADIYDENMINLWLCQISSTNIVTLLQAFINIRNLEVLNHPLFKLHWMKVNNKLINNQQILLDQSGNTLMHLAILTGSERIINSIAQSMINFGYIPYINQNFWWKNSDGLTPLETAASLKTGCRRGMCYQAVQNWYEMVKNFSPC